MNVTTTANAGGNKKQKQVDTQVVSTHFMMTLWYGKVFRITDPFVREIHLFVLLPVQAVEQIVELPRNWDALPLLWP